MFSLYIYIYIYIYGERRGIVKSDAATEVQEYADETQLDALGNWD